MATDEKKKKPVVMAIVERKIKLGTNTCFTLLTNKTRALAKVLFTPFASKIWSKSRGASRILTPI